MVDVSVVIPTYNRASLVKEAIDSVLAQSVSVRELIVVDDGSTDDTRQQLAGYGDRIRVLIQAQAGHSAARNRGMRAANGKWIAFLDHDDVWLPAKIERQMEMASKNPALALLYCSDYAVDEQLRVLYTRAAGPVNRGDVFERLVQKNFIFTSCVIARRDAVEKVGYMDPTLKFASDWDLWLKVASEFPVDFVAEPLVLYRQSASCATRDMKADDLFGEMQLVLERALTLRRVSGKTRRLAQSDIHLQWASSCLNRGMADKAFSHLLRAIISRPESFHGYRLLAYSLIPGRSREWIKRLVGRG